MATAVLDDDVLVEDEEDEVEAPCKTCGAETEDRGDCYDCGANGCAEHQRSCTWCSDPLCLDCGTESGGLGVLCTCCHEDLRTCQAHGCNHRAHYDDMYHCESCEDWYCDSHTCECGCGQCAECGGDEEDGGEGGGGSEGRADNCIFDKRTITGSHRWNADSYKVAWPVDFTISLNASAAGYYLLEAVQHNLQCGDIAEPMLLVMSEEAKQHRADLVGKCDPAFRNYVDMVIGGELRYHRAVGNAHLRGDRTWAWADWKIIRDEFGLRALEEAAALFRDMGSGSVGGEPWAQACDLLHARLANKITPEQWVDRVFTMQHNTGSLLNKVGWGPHYTENGQTIPNEIGPAHSGNPTDWLTLLNYADPDHARLFNEWLVVSNRNRMRWRIPMWRIDKQWPIKRLRSMMPWLLDVTRQGWCWFGEGPELDEYHELAKQCPPDDPMAWQAIAVRLARQFEFYRYWSEWIGSAGWMNDPAVLLELSRSAFGVRPPLTIPELFAMSSAMRVRARALMSSSAREEFGITDEVLGIEPEPVPEPPAPKKSVSKKKPVKKAAAKKKPTSVVSGLVTFDELIGTPADETDWSHMAWPMQSTTIDELHEAIQKMKGTNNWAPYGVEVSSSGEPF